MSGLPDDDPGALRPQEDPPMPPPAPAEGNRVARPATMTAAMVLCIVAAACWFLVSAHFNGMSAAGTPVTQTIGVELALQVAYVVFAVKAARGRPWTRIGIPLCTLALYFAMLPFAWLGFAGELGLYGDVYSVLDIVAVGASLAALVLLYLPPSNEHFRRRAT